MIMIVMTLAVFKKLDEKLLKFSKVRFFRSKRFFPELQACSHIVVELHCLLRVLQLGKDIGFFLLDLCMDAFLDCTVGSKMQWYFPFLPMSVLSIM